MARKTGLTRDEALTMLQTAPDSSSPWKHNPILTEAWVLEVVRGAVLEQPDDDHPLKAWLANRVRQVVTGRKRATQQRIDWASIGPASWRQPAPLCEHDLPMACCKPCRAERKAQERVPEGDSDG